MKEKIKRMIKWLLNNWVKYAEIAVVIWAINGIWESSRSIIEPPGGSRYLFMLSYFLSSILILYLLKKYERNN